MNEGILKPLNTFARPIIAKAKRTAIIKGIKRDDPTKRIYKIPTTIPKNAKIFTKFTSDEVFQNINFYLECNIVFKYFCNCVIFVLFFEEIAIMSCQKNIFSAYTILFKSSLFESLSTFERTTKTGSSSFTRYSYISISDACGHIFESIKISTF